LQICDVYIIAPKFSKVKQKIKISPHSKNNGNTAFRFALLQIAVTKTFGHLAGNEKQKYFPLAKIFIAELKSPIPRP